MSSFRALAESLDRCVDPNDPEVNYLLRSLATYAMVQALYFSTGRIDCQLLTVNRSGFGQAHLILLCCAGMGVFPRLRESRHLTPLWPGGASSRNLGTTLLPSTVQCQLSKITFKRI